MAAASISHSGSTTDMAYEDYSLYSNLSDDELMQLAIKRSLTETNCSTATTNTTNTRHDNRPNPPARNTNQPSRPLNNPPPSNSSQNPPAVEGPAYYSSPNPPTEKPPDMKTFDGTVSRFITGSGKRMIVYRKLDGSIVYLAPEPEEEEEPLFKAIRDGDARKVKSLAMCPGTNLMLPSKPGWLAIHQAAWFGQEACLRVLHRHAHAQQSFLVMSVFAVAMLTPAAWILHHLPEYRQRAQQRPRT